MNPAPDPQVYYQGRWWDAPFTDGAEKRDLTNLPGHPGGPRPCDYCAEPIAADDDAILLPYILGHLECHLRSALGDVAHLNGHCSCNGGPVKDRRHVDDQDYRNEARDTLAWLINHHRGRFRD